MTWPPLAPGAGVSIASRSFFLIRELHLGKLSETVIVHGNAPHARPRFLVSHLIGNRASFLCTKPNPRKELASPYEHGLLPGTRCASLQQAQDALEGPAGPWGRP